MRKIFVMLLAVVMVMSLVACGGSSSGVSAPAETKAPETVAETAAETEVVTTEAVTEVATTEAVETEYQGETTDDVWEVVDELCFHASDGKDYKVIYEDSRITIGNDEYPELLEYKKEENIRLLKHFVYKFFISQRSEVEYKKFDVSTLNVSIEPQEVKWYPEEYVSLVFNDEVQYNMYFTGEQIEIRDINDVVVAVYDSSADVDEALFAVQVLFIRPRNMYSHL